MRVDTAPIVAESNRFVFGSNLNRNVPELSPNLWPLPYGFRTSHPEAMTDQSYPAVDQLIRRIQRTAASRPDPAYILAQAITMTGAIGMDPYAVLGILLDGAVQTLVKQIPAERQAEAAATLVELLIERLAACGIPGQDQKKPACRG
jgi:hypothetical protein